MKINKLPWFKFYPKDWMTDSGLRLCSWDTKGVYIDLLCIMAESNRYGYLEINDKAPTQEMLMKRLSIHHKTLKKCLRELQENGIISLCNGVLYSRKMAKQFTQHAQQKDFGKKGGNPTLNPTLKAALNPTLKVDKELDTDIESDKVSSNEVLAKAEKPQKSKKLCDSDFLEKLKNSDAYKHLNILIELEKAQIWCETHGKQCTQKYFINWINRNPAPIGILNKLEKPKQETFTDKRNKEFEAKIDALYDIFVSAYRNDVFNHKFALIEIEEKVPDYFEKEILQHIEQHWIPCWIEEFNSVRDILLEKRKERLDALRRKNVQKTITTETVEA